MNIEYRELWEAHTARIRYEGNIEGIIALQRTIDEELRRLRVVLENQKEKEDRCSRALTEAFRMPATNDVEFLLETVRQLPTRENR